MSSAPHFTQNMDTVELELGGRSFRACMLTVEEDGNLHEIVRRMQAPGIHWVDPDPIRGLIREVSEILAAAIARSGATVTVDELLELANASGSGAFESAEAATAFVRGAHEMARACEILRAAMRWDKAPAN